MCNIAKGFIRFGLISGLALGGLTLLLGPGRVAGGLAQLRTSIQDTVDSCVDDPVALRRQLESLADEYPDRIADVRGELAQVDNQMAQLSHDADVARRVIAMTGEDLAVLKNKITRAEAEVQAASYQNRNVQLRFGSRRYDLDDARVEAQRIGQVQLRYRDRLAADEQQIGIMQKQKSRLSEILAKLESEYSTFQSQLWQIDRQIDAIERNERLIEVTEQMNESLEDYDHFEEVGNFRQIESKLAELRAEQEAKLQVLAEQSSHRSYEDRAKEELSGEQIIDPFDTFEEHGVPDDAESDDQRAKTGSFAWHEPVVID